MNIWIEVVQNLCWVYALSYFSINMLKIFRFLLAYLIFNFVNCKKLWNVLLTGLRLYYMIFISQLSLN